MPRLLSPAAAWAWAEQRRSLAAHFPAVTLLCPGLWPQALLVSGYGLSSCAWGYGELGAG